MKCRNGVFGGMYSVAIVFGPCLVFTVTAKKSVSNESIMVCEMYDFMAIAVPEW